MLISSGFQSTGIIPGGEFLLGFICSAFRVPRSAVQPSIIVLGGMFLLDFLCSAFLSIMMEQAYKLCLLLNVPRCEFRVSAIGLTLWKNNLC